MTSIKRSGSRARFSCLVVAAAALASLAAGPVGQTAGNGRPLPSFTVAAPDGRPVAASALCADPHWVLVYVRPGGSATPKLLSSLADWQFPPELSRRVALVVEGRVDQAAAYLSGKLPAQGGIAWYADTDGQAAGALRVPGALALAGIAGAKIEWSLQGVLNDPAAYEPVLRAWIGAPPVAR